MRLRSSSSLERRVINVFALEQPVDRLPPLKKYTPIDMPTEMFLILHAQQLNLTRTERNKRFRSRTAFGSPPASIDMIHTNRHA